MVLNRIRSLLSYVVLSFKGFWLSCSQYMAAVSPVSYMGCSSNSLGKSYFPNDGEHIPFPRFFSMTPRRMFFVLTQHLIGRGHGANGGATIFHLLLSFFFFSFSSQYRNARRDLFIALISSFLCPLPVFLCLRVAVALFLVEGFN